MSEIPPRPEPPRRLADVVRAWVQWYGLSRLAVTAGSMVAVVVGAALLLRPAAPPVEATLPVAARPSTTSAAVVASSVVSAATVVVHVAGAVAAPGVYTLASGARVADALIAAGGPVPTADPDALNLAAALTDGSRIYVPEHGEPLPEPVLGVTTPDAVAAGPIDLNSASAAQLDGLPGIGPATAAAIVSHREQRGPFGTVDDLADVRGIGPAKLDALRGLVSV